MDSLRIRALVTGFALLLLSLPGSLCAIAPQLNSVQVLHAHNAYHACPDDSMQALFNSSIGKSVAKALEGDGDAAISSWYYTWPSYYELLRDWGVRSLEIDVYYDNVGGLYLNRAGPKLALIAGVTKDRSAVTGPPELRTPGWKVMHVPDFDYHSTCNTFTDCLAQIANWTKSHPGHDPVFIHVELKTWFPGGQIPASLLSAVNSLLKSTAATYGPPTALVSTPQPDASHLRELEDEMIAAFGREALYTPDDFRGSYPSLRERVDQTGWPLLSELRGKIIPMALGSGAYLSLLNQTRPGGRGGVFYIEPLIGSPRAQDPDTVFVSTDMGVLRAAALWRSAVQQSGGPQADVEALDEYLDIQAQLDALQLQANATGSNSSSGTGNVGTAVGYLNLTGLTLATRLNNNVTLVPANDNRTIATITARTRARAYQAILTQIVTGQALMLRADADNDDAAALYGDASTAAGVFASGTHMVHTNHANGWVTQCGAPSPYTVRLRQQREGDVTGVDGKDTSAAATLAANKTEPLLSSACDPVTAPQECAAVPLGQARPPANCSCYQQIAPAQSQQVVVNGNWRPWWPLYNLLRKRYADNHHRRLLAEEGPQGL